MKKWGIGMMLLVGSLFLFQSCKDDDDDDFTMDRQVFVTEASSGNNLEIRAGELAIDKGQSQEVRDYGQHMVTDHTIVGVELAAIAVSKGISVSLDLLSKHQQQYDALNLLTGSAFDLAFANLMVDSHEDQIELFERASVRVNDADLRDFAGDKLPALRTHLEEARDLRDSLMALP